MDLQKMVDEMNERFKIESGKEYNLGNFINDLYVFKDELLNVEFDDGNIPKEFDSWRGSYCELSLTYDTKGSMDVNTLYKLAYNSNGSIFTGYKGGEFTMDLKTPIHQANYGEVGIEIGDEYLYKKIIGIKKDKDKIIIITKIDKED